MKRSRKGIELPPATFTCEVCGETFIQRLDESFLAFSERVYDDHTEIHISRGEMPSGMRVETESIIQELAAMLRKNDELHLMGDDETERALADERRRREGK